MKKIRKSKPRMRGVQASDADTEASEEAKFLSDKWLLTCDRVHNKSRKELFAPDEDPDEFIRRSSQSLEKTAEDLCEELYRIPARCSVQYQPMRILLTRRRRPRHG